MTLKSLARNHMSHFSAQRYAVTEVDAFMKSGTWLYPNKSKNWYTCICVYIAYVYIYIHMYIYITYTHIHIPVFTQTKPSQNPCIGRFFDSDRRGAKPTEVTLETPQVTSSFDRHSLRMSQRNPNHQLETVVFLHPLHIPSGNFT